MKTTQSSPSLAVGGTWGEGEYTMFTPTLTLPHQGGGEMGCILRLRGYYTPPEKLLKKDRLL